MILFEPFLLIVADTNVLPGHIRHNHPNDNKTTRAEPAFKVHAMTRNQNDETPPGVRLMTDGGTDPADRTVSKTVHADAVVEREVDDDEHEMLRVPISSTRPDRENDEFAREALEAMADQIREDKPLVFQNHGLAGSWMDAIPYDQSETIGTHMDAEVEEADDGEAELFAYINPDGTHEEGERMLRQVRDEGQAIKFSVGFRVHQADEKTDDAGNEIGSIFTQVDLMEDSKVGIPANPDASAPVKAKGVADDLPGVKNHPMIQMMRAMGGGAPQAEARSDGRAVAKGGVDLDSLDVSPGDTRDAVREELEGKFTEGEIAEIMDVVDPILDDASDAIEETLPEDGDGDGEEEEGGDGEGDDDDDDDDDEEESSTAPDDGKDTVPREEHEALKSEVEKLRDAYDGDLGESKTADPTDDVRPDVDADADPDDGKDDDGEDEPSDETKTEDSDTDSGGPLFSI